MNRLSPWIVRRPRPALAFAAAADVRPEEWLDDVRLFLTGWVGGLVFFGTLLG